MVLRVRATHRDGSTGEPVPALDIAETRSDARGEFEFRGAQMPEYLGRPENADLWLSHLDIVARAPGLGLGWVHLDERPEARIALAAPVAVQGRVVDSDNKPVAGAEIRLKYLSPIWHPLLKNKDRGPWPASDDLNFINLTGSRMLRVATTTDADGRFVLTGLPSGLRATLAADHPDFLVATVDAATSSDPAEVERATTSGRPLQSGDVRASLKRAHHIAVRVVDAETGAPVSGALLAIPPTTHPPEGVADGNGRFEYHQAPDGDFSIYVYAPPQSDYLDTQQTIDLKAGAYKREAVVRLPRGLPVAGRVVDEQSGRGISGVTVFWYTDRPYAIDNSTRPMYYGRDTTDEQGHFRMPVAPGKVTVAIGGTVAGYRPSLPFDHRKGDPKLRRQLDVAAGERVEEIEFRLAPVPVFHGTVVDPAGLVVAGAEIAGRIQARSGNAYQPFLQRADDAGKFQLPDLFQTQPGVNPGDSFVTFRDRGRRLGAVATIRPGQPADKPIDVRLSPMGTVAGRIVDAATGSPVRLARVRLWVVHIDEGGRSWTEVATAPVRTDVRGAFSILGTIPGVRYFVDAEAADYKLDAGSTSFIAGENENVGDLKMRRVDEVED